MAQLLITGGAGFIGSHTCLVLLQEGHSLVVLDNYSNSSPVALERVAALVGLSFSANGERERLQLVQGDIRDSKCLDQLFNATCKRGQPIEAVIHFAGLKAVGESVRKPLRYWDVNLTGTGCLLAAMDAHGCRTLVFSSRTAQRINGALHACVTSILWVHTPVVRLVKTHWASPTTSSPL